MQKEKINPQNRKLVAIVGATASGKTVWAKNIARMFNGQIISVDSRQIYKGMDIGTAKDKTFPQDMIDIVEPNQTFTLADYQNMVGDLIEKYFSEGITPVLAGGTGLYLDAVIYGYQIPDFSQDSLKIRAELEKNSDEELHQKLVELDSWSAQRIDPKNRRRVIRAIEVSIITSKPYSEQLVKRKPNYDVLIVGIDASRETLYAKIDARVERMVKDGLVEEVRGLLEKYASDLPSLNTIGYKEIIDYLQGRITIREAIQRIQFNTHAYVRRQITWFKRDPNIKWVKNIEEAEKLIERFLKKA